MSSSIAQAELIHEKLKTVNIETTRLLLKQVQTKINEIRDKLVQVAYDKALLIQIAETLDNIFTFLATDGVLWTHGLMQPLRQVMIHDTVCFDAVYVRLFYTAIILAMLCNILERHKTGALVDDFYRRAENVITYLRTLEMHLTAIMSSIAKQSANSNLIPSANIMSSTN